MSTISALAMAAADLDNRRNRRVGISFLPKKKKIYVLSRSVRLIL